MNEKMAETTGTVHHSPDYTLPNSYSFRINLYGNGDSNAHAGFVSLFFCLRRGPHDAQLQWPFNNRVKLAILKDNNNNTTTTTAAAAAAAGSVVGVVKEFKINPDTDAGTKAEFGKIGRPGANQLLGRGLHRFISHEELRRHMKNNRLIIRCEIL